MNDFLVHLGALALGGTGAILLLRCAALLTRSRYAARWRCWGWLLLCLRLALPVPLPSFAGTQTGAPIRISVPQDQIIYQSGPALPSPSPAPSASGAASGAAAPQVSAPAAGQTPAVRDRGPAITLTGLLFAVWLAGAAGAILWKLWDHLRFLRYLRRWCAPVNGEQAIQIFRQTGKELGLKRLPELLACQGLPAPMLAGVLRPRLLLPREPMERTALRCSLLHELTHFRRRDILFKTLVMWVGALYWFDPAVWLMSRWVERDIELSCDDAVLRRLSPEERAVYGKTILQAAAHWKEVS